MTPLGRPWKPRNITRLFLALALFGCRDEQAGPRQNTLRAQAPRLLQSAPSELTFRSGASFAQGAVLYIGSIVSPPRAEPGRTVTLRHYFQATRPPPQGFQFFTHIVDAQSLQMLGNADHEIQGGALPLAAWPEGKIVEDVHGFSIPEAPSGKARVLLGFWRDETRLPVDSPAAHDGQGRMFGPEIETGALPLPEYVAKKVRQPPIVDGELSDPAWQGASAVTLVGSYDGRRPSLRTVARIVYDEQALYAAFEVEDVDVWGTLVKRDEPIYNEEVVELFLDANADGRTYNELQVSPNNVHFDAYFPAPRQGMDLTYDAQMKTAVKVEGTLNNPQDRDKGWNVELRVPFTRLALVPHIPPKPGDRWRFNMYRLEHIQRRHVEGQAFSPLGVGDFHYVPKFGWLVFSG
jgi:hypothetical protein